MRWSKLASKVHYACYEVMNLGSYIEIVASVNKPRRWHARERRSIPSRLCWSITGTHFLAGASIKSSLSDIQICFPCSQAE